MSRNRSRSSASAEPAGVPEPAKQHAAPPAAPGRALQVQSVVVGRIDWKEQNRTIEELAAEGYEHYETMPIDPAQVLLRFRRHR